MTSWQERKPVGDAHEQRVATALRQHGWTVQLCGQGTYPLTIQKALIRTRSALRQFPDLIAARGSELITVDAKDRMPSTHSDRYAISTATLNAGLLLTAAHAPTPLYYVFGDMKSSRPPKSFTTPNTPSATTAAPTTSSVPIEPTPSTRSSAAPPPERPDGHGLGPPAVSDGQAVPPLLCLVVEPLAYRGPSEAVRCRKIGPARRV